MSQYIGILTRLLLPVVVFLQAILLRSDLQGQQDRLSSGSPSLLASCSLYLVATKWESAMGIEDQALDATVATIVCKIHFT